MEGVLEAVFVLVILLCVGYLYFWRKLDKKVTDFPVKFPDDKEKVGMKT